MIALSGNEIVVIVLMFAGLNLAWSRYWSKVNSDDKNERRDKAFEVLKRNGLTANLYLAGIDENESAELKAALMFLGDRGHIITDSQGRIVGKIASPAKQGKQGKQEYIRLIVDNTR